MNNEFDGQLLKEEIILWTGKPGASLFVPADVFLVPFSLVWGGFALFWEATVLKLGGKAGATDPPIIFPVFGSVFVMAGLYFIVGRFFYKRYKNRRTFYAVTNQRVIVLTRTMNNPKVQAAFIKLIPTVNKRSKADGSGTLRFGNNSGVAAMYENTGMDFLGGFYGEQAPVFHAIADVERVYKLVAEIQFK